MNGKRMLCQTKRKHTEFIRIRWTDYYNRMAAENKAIVEIPFAFDACKNGNF